MHLPSKIKPAVRFFLIAIWTLFALGCYDDNLTKIDLEQGLFLTLPDSSFLKIKDKRKQALKSKLLVKSKADYVEGILSCNGKKLHVKVRLKGDLTDHFRGNRWSFRVIAENGTILNHKKVSIQGVHTRAYLNEWMFHKMLEEENIVNLQYEFLPFSINDTLSGIYAIESCFDNYLLIRSNRPIGPIFKMDEDDFWNKEKYYGNANRDNLLMRDAKIKLCNKKWGKQSENVALVKKAKKLLNDFKKGKRSCDEVFDIKIWAKYIAINELFGGNHALRWHNLKLYFNVLTKKFEPIGFDLVSWMPKGKPIFYLQNNVELFHKQMFKDTNYVNFIHKEMTRLTDKIYLDTFFEKHWEKLKTLNELLKKEKPNYKFWKSAFYYSQKRILKELNALDN